MVNKVWANQFGIISDIDWSTSIGDNQGNTFTLGHTVISNDQINVLLTKQNAFGQILWEKQFGTINEKNYGVNLTFDDSGNIFVIAASYSIPSQQYDYLVIKYDQSANELWHFYHDGDGGDDIPTALSYLSSEDKLYLTGASYQQGSETDYLTLKVNPNNGNIEWTQNYDFHNLGELPVSITTYAQGKIIVTGGSAYSLTDWDMATVIYSPQGQQINVSRIKNPIPGFDQPSAMAVDASDNIYITGNRSKTGGHYDIYTLKLDVNLNIIWEATYDGAGMEDNAYDIKLDNSGNIYVCGTTEKSNNGRDLLLLKYNSNGNEIWHKKRRADNHQNIAVAKKIALTPNGEILVAGEISEGSFAEAIVIKYDVQGNKIWETKPNKTSSDAITSVDKVNGIHVKNTNVYVGSTAVTNGIKTYQTSKLEEYDRNLTFDLDVEGKPYQVSDEVIIRFNPNVINTTFVNDPTLKYGTVSDVITNPAVITSMGQALSASKNFSQWKLLKIFNDLNTSNTTTLTRTGETIPMPSLWSAMILKIENGISVETASNNLSSIATNSIMYAHPNGTFKLGSPNDPLYNLQTSLNAAPDPDAQINIEPAWDLIENSPTPWDKTIRVGVFDTGVEFEHEDFICPESICGGLEVDGTMDRSIVFESVDFISTANGEPLESIDIHGHGTQITGIIGALRNNLKGVAGIAGGDLSNNAPSVQMHSYRVANAGANALSTDMVKSWSHVLNPDGEPLIDIGNHSTYKSSPSASAILRETYELAVKTGIIFVNLRGNDGNADPIYPTNFRDDWSISVGSSGIDGRYLQTSQDPLLNNTVDNDNGRSSSFGLDVDLIAPGTTALITTTRPSSAPIPINPLCDNLDPANDPSFNIYNCFSGTSAAAPHVAGVSALLLEHYEGVNLSIEDIEHLLEYSAVDIAAPFNDPPFDYPESYDEYNGWGRLNAEDALKLIDVNHDNFKVIHVKVNGANITLPSDCDDNTTPSNDDDCLEVSSFQYPFENPQTGTIVTKLINGTTGYLSFKKTHTAPFQINLCNFGGNSNTNLVAFMDSNKKSFWERNSNAESNLWGDQIGTPPNSISDVEIIPGDHFTIESLEVNMMGGCPIVEGVLKGYSYKVFSPNFPNDVEEFPHPSTTTDGFAFSLLLENADNVTNEIEVDHIPDVSTSNKNAPQNQLTLNAFPNPTKGEIQIDYQTRISSNIFIQILGVNGQKIIGINLPNQTSGNHSEMIDLTTFPNGVYFCKVQSEYEVVTQKIIKN